MLKLHCQFCNLNISYFWMSCSTHETLWAYFSSPLGWKTPSPTLLPVACIPPLPQSSQLTPRLADRRTVSLVCCCVCVLEGQSHRRVSVTPRTKRLGSLASCWGSEPWPAWSMKPCQMEPFQNNESWSLWLKTRGWLLRGCRGWTFSYSKWKFRLVLAVFRYTLLFNNVEKSCWSLDF